MANNDMQVLGVYANKIVDSLVSMINTPFNLAFTVPIISISMLSSIQTGLIILFIAYTCDFFTGILASWVEMKESKSKVKVYFIESSKLRKSVVKAISYLLLIFFVYAFEKIFFLKTVEVTSVSSKQLTISVVAVGVCSVIEILSIFENLKRAGFDILKRAESSIVSIKKTIARFQKLF